MSESANGVELAAVVAEKERLENNLSALLCDLTGGRLSKTTYNVRTMIAEVEDYFNGLANERAESAEAALAVAHAQVEAVRALVDEWSDWPITAEGQAADLLRSVHAALSSAAPHETSVHNSYGDDEWAVSCSVCAPEWLGVGLTYDAARDLAQRHADDPQDAVLTRGEPPTRQDT